MSSDNRSTRPRHGPGIRYHGTSANLTSVQSPWHLRRCGRQGLGKRKGCYRHPGKFQVCAFSVRGEYFFGPETVPAPRRTAAEPRRRTIRVNHAVTTQNPMPSIFGALSCSCLLIAALAPCRPLDALEPERGALTWRLPGDWIETGGCEATREDDGTLGEWRDADSECTLRLSVSPEPSVVSPLAVDGIRSVLRAGLQASSGVRDVRCPTVERTSVDGIPAYRVRVGFTREVGGFDHELEQLLYLIAADRTYVLTFTAPRRRFAAEVASFEAAIASLSLRRPIYLTLSPERCCAVLALVVAICALRRAFRGLSTAAARRGAASSPRSARSL